MNKKQTFISTVAYVCSVVIFLSILVIATTEIEYREIDGDIEIWKKIETIDTAKLQNRIDYLEELITDLSTNNDTYNECLQDCKDRCSYEIVSQISSFYDEIDSLNTTLLEYGGILKSIK